MVALALTGAYLTPSLPVRGKASLIERALTYLRANANFGRTSRTRPSMKRGAIATLNARTGWAMF
jgi:hypothetical protein